MICKHRIISLSQNGRFAFTAHCHDCNSYICYNASVVDNGPGADNSLFFEFPKEAQAGWVLPITLSAREAAGRA